MKFAKRCIAMLLAFSMCAGMMFSTAYAEELHEHTWGFEGSGMTPTCTDEGTDLWRCSGCGEIYKETLAPMGHKGSWETVEEATCTGAGQEVFQCMRCGDVETRPIPALDHELELLPGSVTPATCEFEGAAAYLCTRCGVVEKVSTPTADHDFVDGVCTGCGAEEPAQPVKCTGKAGCTAEEHNGTCPENSINKPKTPEEPAPECTHSDPTHHSAVPATCTEDGVKAHWVCNSCGKMFVGTNDTEVTLKDLVVPAASHHYVDGVCTECGAGEAVRPVECTGEAGCTAEKHKGTCPENPINKPETPEEPAPECTHSDPTHHSAVPATCTESGVKAYWVCNSCGKMFTGTNDTEMTLEDLIIPAAGSHRYSGKIDEVPATCGKDGVKAHYECIECGALLLGTHECTEEDLVIPAAGMHRYSEKIDEVPATCTEAGVEAHYECIECGALLLGTHECTEEELAIPTVGHSYTYVGGNGTSHKLECEDCGETVSEGHTIVRVVEQEAACESEGLVAYKCEDCGYVLKEEVIPATGHDYVDGVCTGCQKPDPVDPYIKETPEHMHGAGDEHKIGPVTVYGEASCTQASYKVFYCFTCGGYFKETVPAAEHVWSTDWAAGGDGHHHVCEVCGRAQVTSAVPHAPSAAVRETEDGVTYDVVRCADCGTEMNRTIVIDDPDIPMIDVPSGEPDDEYADDGEVELDDTAVPLAGLVTRAELVGLLYDREGSPAAGMPTFEDVPYYHEYARAVGWAQANGIAFGVGGNRFAPDELVTAGQARLFLERYAQYKGVEVRELAALIGLDDDDILDNAGDVVGEFFGDDPPEFGEDAA